MSRLWISVLLLVALSVLSVFGTMQLCGTWEAVSRALTAALEAGDVPAAMDALADAEKVWQEQLPRLIFLMDRDLLDDVDASLSEARTALENHQLAEYRRLCAHTLAYLNGLLSAELPTLKNLL